MPIIWIPHSLDCGCNGFQIHVLMIVQEELYQIFALIEQLCNNPDHAPGKVYIGAPGLTMEQIMENVLG